MHRYVITANSNKSCLMHACIVLAYGCILMCELWGFPSSCISSLLVWFSALRGTLAIFEDRRRQTRQAFMCVSNWSPGTTQTEYIAGYCSFCQAITCVSQRVFCLFLVLLDIHDSSHVELKVDDSSYISWCMTVVLCGPHIPGRNMLLLVFCSTLVYMKLFRFSQNRCHLTL